MGKAWGFNPEYATTKTKKRTPKPTGTYKPERTVARREVREVGTSLTDQAVRQSS